LNIGEKLKRARMDANMTQEALAEILAVSRQTISNWENGKSYPDIASIIVLSDVYHVTLDSLLKGDDEMIKHLKDSTDTVKSNKRVIALSLLAFVFFFAFSYLVVVYRYSLPGLIAVIMFIVAGFIVFYIVKQAPSVKSKERQAEQGVDEQ
jgi:transcriptional regulator with XRE-family HTH domain